MQAGGIPLPRRLRHVPKYTSLPLRRNLHHNVAPLPLAEPEHVQDRPGEMAKQDCHPYVRRVQAAELLDERAQAEWQCDL
jgi:hypothetical protein